MLFKYIRRNVTLSLKRKKNKHTRTRVLSPLCIFQSVNTDMCHVDKSVKDSMSKYKGGLKTVYGIWMLFRYESSR